MVSEDIEGYTLINIAEVMFAGIILVILLFFVYNYSGGEGFRQTQNAIDLSVFLNTLSGIDNIEVEKELNVGGRLIIRENYVKFGGSKRDFNSGLEVDFDEELVKGANLRFVKTGNKLEVKVDA